MINEFLKGRGKFQPIYFYIFTLFVLLVAMISIRIAGVFATVRGEMLSDTLLITIAGTIVGLLTNFNWNRSAEQKKSQGVNPGLEP